MGRVGRWQKQVSEGGNPRDIKVLFAKEIVARFHGIDAAKSAHDAFERRYRDQEAPENLAETRVSLPSDSIRLDQLLRQLGECKSASEAKRAILGGGVRINGEKITNADSTLRRGERLLLRVGKNPFRLVLLQ